MRGRLQYITQNSFRGGVNQEPSAARTNQVLDARNVYINERGDLAKRPGSRLESISVFSQIVFNTTSADLSDGTTSFSNFTNLNSFTIGDYWYVGIETIPSLFDFTRPFIGVNWFRALGGTNGINISSDTMFVAEYWDSVKWRTVDNLLSVDPAGLDLVKVPVSTTASLNGPFDVSLTGRPVFPLFVLGHFPKNWTSVSVGGLNRFWFRFRIIGQDVTATDVNISGSTEITQEGGFSFGGLGNTLTTFVSGGVFSAELNVSRRRVQVYEAVDSDILLFFANTWSQEYEQIPKLNTSILQPATLAVVPEFSRVFLATGHTVFEVPADEPTGVFDFRAQVNASPAIVGDEDGVQETDATYDRDTIAQLDVFPAANYLLYFKGRLWAAGLKDEPFTVRWSGPALDNAVDVWPSVSFEILSEDDNSPITGLSSLNEHPVIFKRDSIWILVFTGTNELGLATFAPVKVVSGIGTVSNASIQLVNGRLIFLAEDGFYAFDGTPNVQKLSENIDEQVQKIVPSRKAFATAVRWRTKSLYMCAASIDGATENNFVFVFDYKHGGWWFWDELSVQSWLLEEDQFDLERVSFGDTQGRIFELTDARRTDAGRTIPVYIEPFRMGYGDGVTKRWNDFRAWGSNETANIILDVLRYDESTGEVPVSMQDPTEAKWDEAEWDTDNWVNAKRRERRIRLRETSEWIQPRISHNTDEKFELYGFTLGFTPVGFR